MRKQDDDALSPINKQPKVNAHQLYIFFHLEWWKDTAIKLLKIANEPSNIEVIQGNFIYCLSKRQVKQFVQGHGEIHGQAKNRICKFTLLKCISAQWPTHVNLEICLSDKLSRKTLLRAPVKGQDKQDTIRVKKHCSTVSIFPLKDIT